MTAAASQHSRRTALTISAITGALLAIGVPGVLLISGLESDVRPAVTRAPVSHSPAPVTGTPSAADVTAYQAHDERRAGDAAYNDGDFDAAASRYQAAVAAAPDDPQSRNNLAQVLVRQGRPAQALVALDAAIERDPDQWSYRFNRARVYGLLDRWPDAVTEYRVAARLFPDDYATHYNLGLALLKLDRYTDAAVALERAVALGPEQHDFLISLATAYVGAGQTAQARTAFERFLAAAPSAPDAPRVRALLASIDESGQ